MAVVNVGLLKEPANWFLVAFVMALLAFAFHFIFKDKANG